MPLVRPVAKIGLEAPVTVTAVPLDEVQVTLKLVAVPPAVAAVKLMLADALPAVAVPMVGAEGAEGTAAIGDTETAPEALPVPAELAGVTVQE